ncbi:hypothetical protein [Frankia sp. AgB32]|uniref:hypothetical protein n=1 Tax=Frankia sp. AgB32 TaxID=631119 RepID=UPI00200E05AC|nr:hypothetical protein [Frankia sp. AgB32]MCK9897413.1 hypothetical protein [Frankia sp. AgB32]
MSLTQQMTPYGGPPGRRRRTFLLAVAALVLIATTVGITLAVTGSGDHTQTAAPTPAPTRFGIPSPQPARTPTAPGPILLPHPARTAPNGVPLGFPHTPEGAASAAIRWSPLTVPAGEDRQIGVFRTIETDKAFARDAAALHADYRAHPPAADDWSTNTPVALRILPTADARRATVAVLATLQVGNSTGVTSTRPWQSAFYLVWQDGDWHLEDIEDVPDSLKVSSSSDPEKYLTAGWEEFQLG